jgi:hypothetical protein
MSNWESIINIVDDFNDFADVWGNADGIVGILTGDNGAQQICDQLNNIMEVLNQEFQDVVNASHAEAALQQWQAYSSQISNIQSACLNYTSALSTLAAKNNTYYIDWEGQQITFQSWCEGTSGENGSGGALTQLEFLLQNLWNSFSTDGIDDTSLIQAWTNLITSALQSTAPPYLDQTQFTLMLQLMQQIFSMLAAIYYTHESALGLYYALFPANPYNYISSKNDVVRWFGEFGVAETVWGYFGEYLENCITNNNIIYDLSSQQYPIIATSGDSVGPGHYTSISGSGSATDPGYVFTDPVSVYQEGANQFFGNLQFVSQSLLVDGDPYNLNLIYLQGTILTVGPGVNFSVTGTTPPPPQTPNQGSFVCLWGGDPGNGSYPYLARDIASAPAQSNSNVMNVVTGFQFVTPPDSNGQPGNQIRLAVQFAQLDITDPANPIVTQQSAEYVSPPGVQYISVQGWANNPVEINYIDLRPAGTNDNFPLTNISISQTNPTGSGNQVGLVLQNALPLYQATWFQPNSLVANSPPPPPPALNQH